ncbi:hypothetical protein [Pseudomonas aeruginosa]
MKLRELTASDVIDAQLAAERVVMAGMERRWPTALKC